MPDDWRVLKVFVDPLPNSSKVRVTALIEEASGERTSLVEDVELVTQLQIEAQRQWLIAAGT